MAVTPDGGLVVSAKKTLVKYKRSGPTSTTFTRQHDFPDRPGVGWAYPNTGQSVLLPMLPPYTKLWMLSTGGSTVDQAGPGSPASDQAHKIELTDKGAAWQDVGPMPQARVMGDAVTLCDGTVSSWAAAGPPTLALLPALPLHALQRTSKLATQPSADDRPPFPLLLQILYINGASKGIAGWGGPVDYK